MLTGVWGLNQKDHTYTMVDDYNALYNYQPDTPQQKHPCDRECIKDEHMICISFRSSEGKSSVSLCLFLSSSSQHRLGQHRKRQILKSAVFHKSEPHGTVQHALQAPRLQFQQYSQSNWIHHNSREYKT